MLTLFEDIIIEHVLTRLPAKSLVRFRCVCKSWEYVLSNPDPQFISSHTTHTSKIPDNEYLIITTSKNHRYSIDILNRSRFSYIPLDNVPRHDKIVGCINGLVCLILNHLFLLWNPVTGLYKAIAPPQHHLENKMISKLSYGFGWDYVKSEFKIVIYYRVENSFQGFLYTSNSGTWNGLAIPDIFSCLRVRELPDITVKGCPYWSACREDARFYPRFEFKFESGSNQFKKFSLPSQIVGIYHYVLVDLKDCLTMMVYSPSPGTLVDVFHLDENSGVWSKTYTFGPIHCWTGQISQGFKYSGEIVFSSAKMLYDPKTKGIKVIGDGYWEVHHSFSYTPSLVFLHGMEPLNAQSRRRVHALRINPIMFRRAPSHPRSLFSRLLGCLGWN